MKSRPFLRLMWSPQAGFLVLPLTLAASWPIVRNHPSVAGLGAGTGVGPDEILWGESVIFAVVAGFMSGLITRDVLQAPFAFLLPSLRTRVLLGKVALALLIAAGLGYMLANVEGPGAGVPIAACALFFFALGASLSDPVFPKTVVWIVGPLLVIPVWEPAHVQRFFEFAPIIGSVAALGAAIVLGLRELDADTARIRTLGSTRSDKDLVTRSAAFAKRVIGMTPVWRGNPRDGRTADWVEAVHYENFGSRPFEWPTSVVWAVGLNCGMAYALKNPSFAAVMGLMNLAVSGHRMTGRWAYPIARERRANVLWLSSLLDSTAYFALAMLALPAIYAIGLPQVSIIEGGTTRYGLIAPLLVAFATAPIVQWPRVTSHLAPPKLKQFGPLWLRISYRCVWAVTIVTFVLEFLFFVTRFASMNLAILIGVLIGIAFHYYYWVNLRHHFRIADLA